MWGRGVRIEWMWVIDFVYMYIEHIVSLVHVCYYFCNLKIIHKGNQVDGWMNRVIEGMDGRADKWIEGREEE